MTQLLKAADVGVFTHPSVTVRQWEQARDLHGVSLAVVGVWSGVPHDPNPAPESLRNAHQAGLDIAVYAVTNNRRGSDTVAQAVALAGRDLIDECKFFCLDVEVVGAPLLQHQFDDAIATIHDLDQRPLVYTGKWYWDGGGGDHMNNPTWASGVPLWVSIYDGKHDLRFPTYRRFGGWTQPVGKQWTSKGERQLGFLSDISAFDQGWVHAR